MAGLAKSLSEVKGRVVLFIDACHSGGIGAGLATNDGAVPQPPQGLAGLLLCLLRRRDGSLAMRAKASEAAISPTSYRACSRWIGIGMIETKRCLGDK